MVKPVLNPNKAIALCDKNDTRFCLLGSSLETTIGPEHVKVKYPAGPVVPPLVPVDKARVKRSVLCVRADKIKEAKERAAGTEEISVVVTNPSTNEDSDPVNVTIIFDEGRDD